MKTWKGTYTALVTPFTNAGLNEDELRENIQFQIKNGISGIVPLGSTGEASTTSAQERTKIISICVEAAEDKVPVIVGTGTNCTRQTLENTQKAKELGASAALVIVPYYNKPTQEGIYRHFKTLSDATDLPIIVYNCPSRSGVALELPTVLKLAELKNIVGLKDSTGNLCQLSDVLHGLATIRPDFSVLAGDDNLTLPMMSLGACGVISVASNLVPHLMVKMVKALKVENYELGRLIHYQLLPFFKAAFLETNPVPIKTAMQMCGRDVGDCRLPLYAMNEGNLQVLKQVLIQLNLLKV